MRSRSIGLLCLSIALLYVSSVSAATFWEINKWLSKGQYDLAIDALSEQIKAGEADTDNHFLLAVAYYQKIQSFSQNAEQVSLTESTLTDIEKQLDWNLEQVIKLEPNHGPAYYYRALATQLDHERLQGNPEQQTNLEDSIIADFSRSIGLTSEAQPIYQARADFYQKIKSFTKAAADLANIRQFENAGANNDLNAVELKQLNDRYLQSNAGKFGVITTHSGLQYKELKAGKGRKPSAQDTVIVDYVGRLTDGSVFDSSVERGQPAVFPLNQVIKGWTEALQLMNVGDEFEIAVPAELGYGKRGSQGIKPDSVLIFNIHLVGIK